MATKLKRYFWLLLVGIGVSILLALTMIYVTVNFQIILGLGAVAFFLAGFFNRKLAVPFLLKFAIIFFSFATLFSIIVLAELPSLFYFLILWGVALTLGLWRANNRLIKGVLVVLFAIVTLWFGMYKVPGDISKNLSVVVNDRLPTATLHTLDHQKFETSNFQGRIAIIDFFGTWCKPCIQELKELQLVQQAFKTDTSVAFYVINADMGGDTPEKFKRFIEQQSYEFQYLYDHEGVFYRQVARQKSGLPLLMVVDKTGMIRWKHIGYNTAETGFAENLIALIKNVQSKN